jgi:hypothetical protein
VFCSDIVARFYARSQSLMAPLPQRLILDFALWCCRRGSAGVVPQIPGSRDSGRRANWCRGLYGERADNYAAAVGGTRNEAR